MRASKILNLAANIIGGVCNVVLVIICELVLMLLLLFFGFSTRSSIIDSLLMLRPRHHWIEIGRRFLIIMLIIVICVPNVPEILRITAAAVLLSGFFLLIVVLCKDRHYLLVAREAKELSKSMPFLQAIEGIDKGGTTRELIIQKYRHEEGEELLGGADVNQRELNELEIDDSLSDMSRLLYRQSVVATAMMIVGINRVVVRDLEGSVLYTSKGVTLIPLNKKFKILIELAKKLNYEVRIEG